LKLNDAGENKRKAMELFDMTVEGLNQLKQYRAGSPSLNEPSVSDQENRVANLSPSFCNHSIVASLSQTFQKFRSTQEFLIVGVQTDVLFPVGQQRDLAEAIRSSRSTSPQQKAPSVTYVELDSPFGHDAFLIDLNAVGGGLFFPSDSLELSLISFSSVEANPFFLLFYASR
jgi:homoserine O-acetyltransferase